MRIEWNKDGTRAVIGSQRAFQRASVEEATRPRLPITKQVEAATELQPAHQDYLAQIAL